MLKRGGFFHVFQLRQAPGPEAGRVDNGSQLDQLDEDFDEAMLGELWKAIERWHVMTWFSASKVDSTDFKTICTKHRDLHDRHVDFYARLQSKMDLDPRI